MLSGTCQCESVEIQVDSVEPRGINCYCTICRKITGGPFPAPRIAPAGGVRVLRGAEMLSRYSASPGSYRYHCSHCHAPIYAAVDQKPELGVFVPAGLFPPSDISHVVFD